jgi:hypothetical protein
MTNTRKSLSTASLTFHTALVVLRGMHIWPFVLGGFEMAILAHRLRLTHTPCGIVFWTRTCCWHCSSLLRHRVTKGRGSGYKDEKKTREQYNKTVLDRTLYCTIQDLASVVIYTRTMNGTTRSQCSNAKGDAQVDTCPLGPPERLDSTRMHSERERR